MRLRKIMGKVCNLLCLIIIVIFSIVTATDYCNLQTCNEKGSHTMCKYSSLTPAAECVQWSSIGLINAERKAIVDKHNELRVRVAMGLEKRGNPGPQPAAYIMPFLYWDYELENIAQRWALQCNYSHDKCRNVDRFIVGQNLGQTYSSEGNSSSIMQGIIQTWYDEVDLFDRNQVSSYKFDPKTSQYTQLVWYNTTKIGCGQIKYKDPDNCTIYYLVCNYGPSGNLRGHKIYNPVVLIKSVGKL